MLSKNIITRSNFTIAICIPAFNAETFLPTLLNSIKNQIIPFDEVLIYDDCSIDKTFEIAQNFGARVIVGKENVGCSIGKNILAKLTNCDWIHFHDADDDLYETFTLVAHKRLQENPSDIILFDYEYRDGYTRDLLYTRRFKSDLLELDPVKYSILEQINPFCGLYNKKKFIAAGGYDEDVKVLYNEDVAMHCKMAISGLSFSSESELTIINLRWNDSMSSSNLPKTVHSQFEVMKKVWSSVRPRYKNEITTKLWLYIRHAAFYSEWTLVKELIRFSSQVNNVHNSDDSVIFKFLLKINPFASVYIRETINRIFRKDYRKKKLW